MGATRSAALVAVLRAACQDGKRRTVFAARPEADIDARQIPPLTAKFRTDAARGRFYKPLKTSTTVRIDADVLAWLRTQGKGYQSRISAILRREMLVATQSGGGGFREEGRRGDEEPGVDQPHRGRSGEIDRKRGAALSRASHKR